MEFWVAKGGNIYWLVLLASFLFILGGGFVFYVHDSSYLIDLERYGEDSTIRNCVDPETESFIMPLCSLWESYTYFMDAAAHLGITSDVLTKRTVGIIQTFIGIILFQGVILGIVIDTTFSFLDAIREGSTSVVERGHTVVVGWSNKGAFLVQQICESKLSEKKGTIVILVDGLEPGDGGTTKDMVMEDLAEVDLPKFIKLVIRCGDQMSVIDLRKLGCHSAKSVILIAPMGNIYQKKDSKEADSIVLRTLLTLEGMMATDHFNKDTSIIVELRDLDNATLVQSGTIGHGRAESVVGHDILARVMIKATQQPHTAAVLDSLWGFQEHELYVQPWESDDIEFSQVLFRFTAAIPIGFVRGRGGKEEENSVVLNPPDNFLVRKGDNLIILAEDDSEIHVAPEVQVDLKKDVVKDMPKYQRPHREIEAILICGWRRDIQDLLEGLDCTAPPGSTITVLCTKPVEERVQELEECGFNETDLVNIRVIHCVGDASVKRHLLQLQPSIVDMNRIIIVAEAAIEDQAAMSDSHNLAALLCITDIRKNPDVSDLMAYLAQSDDSNLVLSCEKMMKKRGIFGVSIENVVSKLLPPAEEREFRHVPGDVSILVEILDIGTYQVIQDNPALSSLANWSISNNLVAKLLATCSETREIAWVVNGLLDVNGQEIYLRNASQFVNVDERANFFTVMQRARVGDELAIGYMQVDPVSKKETVCLNPKDKREPIHWALDQVITPDPIPPPRTDLIPFLQHFVVTLAEDIDLGRSQELRNNVGLFAKVQDAKQKFIDSVSQIHSPSLAFDPSLVTSVKGPSATIHPEDGMTVTSVGKGNRSSHDF